MTASTASTRGALGRRAKALILGAMIACMGVFAFAGSANAAPVSMDLTNGQLNLGFAFKGAEILPAPPTIQTAAPPAPPTNLPNLWNARDTTEFANPAAAAGFGCLTPVLFNFTTPTPTPTATPNPTYPCTGNPAAATVSGDVTAGAVTIDGAAGPYSPVNKWGADNGFRFPIMVVPNPLDGSPVPVTIASTGPLAGNYDSGTGALDLNGPIEARVLTGLATNPLGSYCALPLVGLTLSTTSNADFPGVPFTSGFDGTGALTGTYNITADATSVGGADCGTVNSVSKGLGSIWVSNGIAEPPTCPENTTGIPPNCEPIPCPPGFKGNEPNCVKLKARISRVTISGPRRARKGQVRTFVIRITNNGNAQAKGVRLVTTGRGVRVNSPVRVINPGITRTVRVRVRFRFPGRFVARASVRSSNAGSRGARKVVRVLR
jgi:hypothetical protein